MLFYLSIAVYISSVIGALILMILGRQLDAKRFRLLAAAHGLLLLFFILTRLFLKGAGSNPTDFSFLLFICSGVTLCGIVWRIPTALPFRIYFSIFVITFPLFIFSPSRLVNFLLTTTYSDTIGKSFPLSGDIYLEQQNSWSGSTVSNKYKVIRKKGLFHKTLARDIQFSQPLDSLRTILYREGDTAILRGYSFHVSFVEVRIDSQDVNVSLKSRNRNTIERRLKP